MEGKDTISNYRSKLDKTLASPDLTNDEIVRTLVNKQLLQSSNTQFEGYIENVVERRSKEVSNFLSTLRSASVNVVERSKSSEESHGAWKVKQDTEEFRVMYKEGPEGTPFHNLLVEGYVEGPLDFTSVTGLCVSWESGLYQKWWPQTAVPTFKVLSSRCLQRVRTGEQISLVRMKVSWPLSSREALVHYFVFEYFQDDLIVVLLNTISDSEAIDRSTHGFARDGIPDADDVVRIDVVGGFALQKMTANRCFFRTIANMDIKLDFVPPAFINFIARQLVGSGFKLYKKEVASASKGDEKFREALKDPLYTRIREALYSDKISIETSPDLESREVLEDIDLEVEDVMVRDQKEPVIEIEEFEEKDTGFSGSSDNNTVKSSNYLNNQIKEKLEADKEEVVISTEGEQPLRTTTENFGIDIKNKTVISPKVEQALETLEKAISIFRGYTGNGEKCRSDINNKGNLRILEKGAMEESMLSQADQTSEKNGGCAESSKIGTTEVTSHEPGNSTDGHASRQKGSNSYIRETNQSKIAPASSDDDRSSPSITKHVVLHSSMNQKTSSTKITELTGEANNVNGSRMTEKKNKKSRFCCLHFVSGY
ncbi:hypothetical protein BUALT_Bualt11G0086200 [Buddleja alternifolia]|uniref:Uncharacterized protein n=1 Tax=Buddleja alternifolia TaxID=168488 RepID=A0AAV6WUF6_9LAMI|nr:hypothetical protein BUALT_Bualt11G0086200 [Buddleja alternifolia]